MRNVTLNDQRLATDDQFLDHVKLPGGHGRLLASARQARDPAASIRIVADYFRTRQAPIWPFYMHGTAWLERDGHATVMAKADQLLRNRFQNSWPPYASADLARQDGRVDWSKGLEQLSTSIGRNTFVPELTTAFALTGETAYLKKAWELIRSFVEAHPFVLDEKYIEDPDRTFGLPPNNGLDMVARAARWLDFMHSGALHAPGVLSDADVFWFVKQCWFYAMQFSRFCGNPMRRDNHHLTDHGHGPLLFGAMFPEFSVARDLLAQGRRTFQFHMRSNLLDDCVYAEHCTKYQYHVFFTYANALALDKVNRLRQFSPGQRQRLTRWAEFFGQACKPDGILAEYGDEFGASLAHFFSSLAAPCMSPELAVMADALGYAPGELCTETPASLARRFQGWEPGSPPHVGLSSWFRKGATCQRVAAAQAPAAVQYANGGFTFFRSAWDRQADFLGVAHYTDSLPHSHTHWDMLSFNLHTQGQTLIGDPATKLYGTGLYGTGGLSRGYMYAPDAHNCLIMNDDTLKPLAALSHGCCWGGYPPRHGLGLFQAGGPVEIAEIWHDAYAPTRHRRYIVHLRGLGFAFVDLLSRPGLDVRPHQYSQRLHFEGDVAIAPQVPRPGGTLRVSRAGAMCRIVPGRETHTVWKSWHDERLAGVPGVPADKVKPAPWVAEVTRRVEGPAVFTTFLLTGASARLKGVEARYLGGRPGEWAYQQHDALSAHELDLGPLGFLWIASCPYGQPLQTAAFTTDAELAVVLTDAKRQIGHWALAKGSHLAVNSKTLVTGRQRSWVTGQTREPALRATRETDA